MTETTASILPGPNVLLMGPPGTGKTYAIGTLVDWAATHNKEVCVLFTENGLESLLGYWTDRGKEVPPNLHWRLILPKPVSLESLIDWADKTGKMSYEMVTKSTDVARGQSNVHVEILRALVNFRDDRTEKEFGRVDQWGSDKIFVIDSFSEVCEAIVKMTIGARPTMAPPEYGMAQNNAMNFLRLYTNGCLATFVLTGHVSREKDEVTGGIKLMLRAIGSAISGDIPKLFSDVIYTVREGDKFYWDTAAVNVDTKTRNLPIASKIPQNFATIMDKWTSRGGK